jgi:hypothetical protein
MKNSIIKSFNTIKEVEDYRAQVNEECDARINFINISQKADNLSNKNFGYLKECFEAFSPKLFETKEGKALINKYLDYIHKNDNLRSLHIVHENIRKANKSTDVDFLIEQIAKVNWGINNDTVNDDVKKLGKVLAEAFLYLGKDGEDLIPKENKSLSTAIDYIAENKLSQRNLADYSSAVKIIKEDISKRETTDNIFETKNLDDLAEELLQEFNKKYSDNLNEEEAKVLKEMASSENREEIFNKYKSICAENISKARVTFEQNGDTKSMSRLTSVLEQVNNKKFSLETVGEDICNLIELSNIFE